MDRAISSEQLKSQSRKRIWWIVSGVSVLILGAWLLRSQLKNRLNADRMLTAVAVSGPIQQSLTASGEVIPAFEQVISSSIQANIQEVLQEVGSEVAEQTPILRLDKSFALLEYQQLQQEWDLQQNGILKLQLELKKALFNLQITDSLQAIEIRQLQSQLADARRLEQVGGETRETIEQLELKLERAELEKRRLEYDLSIEQEQTKVSLRELDIKSRIQQSSMRVMKEKLDRAEVIAARSGVLTWVNENIGTTVQEGSILARVANLSSYKVLGSCSDLYTEQLKIGMSVIVEVSREVRLQGTLTNIRPTVENNVIQFDVQLLENNHPALRPNMRVQTYLITDAKSEAIKVANGAAFQGGTQQYLFVKQGDRAIRREVELGLSNFDEVEILRGIQVGEEVIISDMRRHETVQELIID
ncbi:MAG: HlyD family efflux transporter periplasmic adaptor subunit [Bacteroidota bacterium]